MLSVAGADHIITMDLHASQIQVGAPVFPTLTAKLDGKTEKWPHKHHVSTSESHTLTLKSKSWRVT